MLYKKNLNSGSRASYGEKPARSGAGYYARLEFRPGIAPVQYSAKSCRTSENRQGVEEIRREWRIKLDSTPSAGVNESQVEGVQHLAWRMVAGHLGQAVVLPMAVGFISKQRITEKLEMYTDLVRTPGMQARLSQGGPSQALEDPVACMRLPPELFVHGHALPVRRMPGYRRPNFPTVSRHFAADNRLVNLFHLPAGKLG